MIWVDYCRDEATGKVLRKERLQGRGSFEIGCCHKEVSCITSHRSLLLLIKHSLYRKHFLLWFIFQGLDRNKCFLIRLHRECIRVK
jgi:hypothetical protein